MVKSFKQFLQLKEKMIVFGNNAHYGQIVIMAGGAGSGKSYVAKNLIDTSKFKVIDVDAWKEAFIKLKKYPGWETFNFKDAGSVSRLHLWIMKLGIRDKLLDSLFDPKKNPEVLPNLLFDISLNTLGQLTEITDYATKMSHYKPENIHLVYVLTDWTIALNRNRSRERTLPDGVVLKTIATAAENMLKLAHDVPVGFDGEIKVVIANNKDLRYFTLKHAGESVISLASLENVIQQNIGDIHDGKDIATIAEPGK